MDTPTQVLLGLVTSELGFRRRLGKPAAYLAAVTSLIPDLDILARPFQSEFQWMVDHRTITHSFLFCAAVAFPLAWAARMLARSKVSYRWFLGCALAASLSHPLLDLCTSYGTSVLWPFSDARFAWDFIAIVDIIFTPILLVTLIGCAIARRRSRPNATFRIALFGLLVSMTYLALGALNHYLAIANTRKVAIQSNELPIRVEAFPKIGTIAAWRVVAQAPDAFLVGSWNLGSPNPPALHRLPIDSGDLVERASAHPSVLRFGRFARGMIRPVIPVTVGLPTVEFHDMRYAYPTENPRSLWLLTIVFSKDGSIVRADFVNTYVDTPPTQALKGIWDEMWK